jgi:diguanylate cyclase
VRAIVALGAQMGLDVVAEGVETEAQRALLLLAACPQVQGWLYSRAVAAAEVTARLPKA